MRIKCISKEPHDLGLENGFEPTDLVIGKVYNVYGFEIELVNAFVYISDHTDSSYPSRYSLKYFVIISGRMSKYWNVHFNKNSVQFIVNDWIRFPDFMRIYINSYEPNPEKYGLLNSFFDWKEKIDNESDEAEAEF